MAYNGRDDDLAYGEYHGQGRRQEQESGEGERGFIGDMGKRFFGGGNNQQGQQVRQIDYISMSVGFD
jgi:phospholipase D1/2